MSVARVTEISSRSEKSFEDAINQGIDRANKTLRNVRADGSRSRPVDIENGQIIGYRVNMLVTFVLDEYDAQPTRHPARDHEPDRPRAA